MPFDFGSLCPYQSLILSKVRTGEPTFGVVAAVLGDLQDLLRFDEGDRALISRGDPRREGMLEVAGLHYVVRRRASWTLDDQIVDATNHVALIFRRAHALAIHVSETSVRDVITARLDQPRFAGFGRIEPISAGVLNAAFVDGPAKTLWLSGIHKRTAVKPDAKTLSGVNLRVALDPLADQTYHMTAARSKVHQGRFSAVVGVAPRGSRIWTNASPDWETCKADIGNTLQHLSTVTAGIDAPLPYVAVALDSLEGLGNAYELAIIPPQILADDPSLVPTYINQSI